MTREQELHSLRREEAGLLERLLEEDFNSPGYDALRRRLNFVQASIMCKTSRRPADPRGLEERTVPRQ